MSKLNTNTYARNEVNDGGVKSKDVQVFAFHCIIILIYIPVWKDLAVFEDVMRQHDEFRAKADLYTRYTTNWIVSLSTIVFCGYFIRNTTKIVFGCKCKKLKNGLDSIFYTLSGPLCVFLATFFWGLYYYDRQLVYPVALDKLVSPYTNHGAHTFVIFVAIGQTYFNRKQSPNIWLTVRAQLAFFAAFMINAYQSYSQYHLWLYDFMAVYDEPYRFFVLLSVALYGLVCAFAFHVINNAYFDLYKKKKVKRVSINGKVK